MQANVTWLFGMELNWNENEFERAPQDSEVVYCGRLSLVADLLQQLFKEAYTLQKGLLEVLDKMSLTSGASEEEVSDVVTGGCVVCFPLLHSSL